MSSHTPAEDGLAGVLSAARGRRKEIVVFGANGGDIEARLKTRNASVRSRPLPPGNPAPFVVVRDGEAFRGAVALTAFERFLDPTVDSDRDVGARDDTFAALLELLDGTVFASLDRRQLRATSTEIEDLAYRTATGRLFAGFQRASAFERRAGFYHRLATETDVDVHVFVADDAALGDLRRLPITFHDEPAELIGRYWFVLFDGGDTAANACALVAEDTDEGFYGAWTYDPELVAMAFDAVA